MRAMITSLDVVDGWDRAVHLWQTQSGAARYPIRSAVFLGKACGSPL
jgi:hypothetical protein